MNDTMLQERPCTSPSYFDREFSLQAVKIMPGEYYATADGTAITTLLGSCVSVCLFDRTSRVGGMNHFLLPQLPQETAATRCSRPGPACHSHCSTRYGACAMRQLLGRLQQLGAALPRLEAKIFGAGRVLAQATEIGARNAEFALGYLKERGIRVVSQDLGDCCPRKVFFLPATGQVMIKRLRELPAGVP